MLYGTRSNGKQHGSVLTKHAVVVNMLNRLGYVAEFDLRNIKIIEPAAGDGVFAIEIIKRLHQSSVNHRFSFEESLSNLAFFEVNESFVDRLTNRVKLLLCKYGVVLPNRLIRKENFLLAKVSKCDLIIGNPPYVRHEKIPEFYLKTYRNIFATFTHRSDLYIAFFEKSLTLLSEKGRLSFICSNRWLKNQYGKGLRNLIRLSYSVVEIIDMEGTSPFEEDVMAYPAIVTISNSNHEQPAYYYKIQQIEQLSEIDKSIGYEKTLNINNSMNWFANDSFAKGYYKLLSAIEDQDFKIGIGVATGADKIFIRKDFDSIVEKELLLPIVSSKDLKNNDLNWMGYYILNPFDKSGNLINLNEYPKTKKYFESNKEILLNRHIAKRNPDAWYKTIDRIKPGLANMYKILLPDISGNYHLFIDKGNYYPHHNLYYITGKNSKKLVLLAAILMSDFVKNQLLDFGNKMNGGYPRWQSQNLKKLRIPVIDNIPNNIALSITEAYNRKDYGTVNNLISAKNISKYKIKAGQIKMFEPNQDKYKQ
ncbi:MAG: Eco57I restriction-modification methylase domain-containing protein [Bacteroidota bacterium]|nr:Eco57I restriction-modification methylase domain-containing protein [Bacteroidota bacterium]